MPAPAKAAIIFNLSTINPSSSPDNADPPHDLNNHCRIPNAPGSYLTLDTSGALTGFCDFTQMYSNITEHQTGSLTGSINLDSGEASFSYSTGISYVQSGDPGSTSTFSMTFNGDATIANGVGAGTATFSFSVSRSFSTDQSYSYGGTINFSMTVTPLNAADLSIDHIEVVQVVQDASNTVPLVADKGTVARVFAKADVPLNGATVELTASRGGAPTLLNPTAIVTTVPVRSQVSHSFNFLLPNSWTSAGGLTLEAEVKPPAGISDTNETNNTESTTVNLQGRNGLVVAYLPVCYEPPGQARTCPSALISSHHQMMAKTFPMPDGSIAYSQFSLPIWVWTQPIVDLSQIRVAVRQRYNLLESTDGIIADQLAAWLPAIPGNGNLGISDPLWLGHGREGHVSIQQDVSSPDPINAQRILAHEIAHNLGRRHTNTPDGCGSTDAATDWKPTTDGTIQEIGFDIEMKQVVPATKKDLMTYCAPPGSNLWLSPLTYKALFNANAHPQTHVLSTPASYLLINGSAMSDGSSGTLDTAYVVQSSVPSDPTNPAGNHCLLFGDDTTVIGQYCFNLDFLTHELQQPAAQDWFSLKAPLPPGTTRVALMRGATQLALMQATASAPSLEITSPQTGAELTGDHTITWAASDGDGDPITYTVLYSPDGGDTWLPMEVDTTASEFSLDAADLQASTNGMYRVLASDGLNTTEETVGPLIIGTPFAWGDVDCSGSVNPVDGLKLLRFDAGLSVDAPAECTDIGSDMQFGGETRLQGDVDCSGSVSPVDGLKILRFDGGLAVDKPPGCPTLGEF